VWPADRLPLPAAELDRLADRLRPAFRHRCAELGLATDLTPRLRSVYLPLTAWIARHRRLGGRVFGVNGAQGTGKSTLVRLLQTLLAEGFGLRAAGLSIDDFYRTRAEREHLARTVHPLLITRGVPGTHDVALAIHTIDALVEAGPGDHIPLPAFDKATDDRLPPSRWPVWEGPCDLVLFEGWCVGARPEPETRLHEPVNELERREDPDGRWRRYVNDQLRGPYRQLFARLDRLILLEAPGMACVFRWRLQQERELARRLEGEPEPGLRLMDEAALRRFIQHYERLTRWMLAEMPARADVVLTLGEDHQIHTVTVNRP